MPYGPSPKGAGTRLMGGATPRPPSRIEAQRSPNRPPISPVRTNAAAPQQQRPQFPQMPGQQLGTPQYRPPMGTPPGMQAGGDPPFAMPGGMQGQFPMGGQLLPPGGFQAPMGQQQLMNPQVMQLLMQLLGGNRGGRGF